MTKKICVIFLLLVFCFLSENTHLFNNYLELLINDRFIIGWCGATSPIVWQLFIISIILILKEKNK